MMPRVASLGAGLAFLALVTSGCVTQQGDGVFGPGNSLGGAENNSPALSLKASPARGPGPLEVVFSLSALDRDGDPLTWSLDFGDRSAPAAGSELPAQPHHTYTAPGAYLATFKVVDSAGDSESFVSKISIVVLEGAVPDDNTTNTTQGPEEAPEDYGPPSGGGGGGGGSSSTTSTSDGNGTTSETGTSTDPPSNGTSSTSESSTSDPPTSSSSSSSSDTGTSSSTGTETYSDPGTSSSSTSSSDTSTSSDPEPTGSESQSSTDPPL